MDEMVVQYNYSRFDEYVTSGVEKREFAAFPNHLHAGGQAPNFSGVTLDGDPVHLADMAQRGAVVLEFGSFT